MGSAVGPAGLLRQLAAQATRPDNRGWLGEITVPVLVITGRDDDVCPAAAQEEIVAAVPRAEHVVLDCGHMSPLEQPAGLAAALAAWRR
jgi:pimeloyl-ACP methyl ester carboxylesterase